MELERQENILLICHQAVLRCLIAYLCVRCACLSLCSTCLTSTRSHDLDAEAVRLVSPTAMRTSLALHSYRTSRSRCTRSSSCDRRPTAVMSSATLRRSMVRALPFRPFYEEKVTLAQPSIPTDLASFAPQHRQVVPRPSTKRQSP